MGALDEDTIVAPATAHGRGGIGVIRISGKNALFIAEKICGVTPPPRCATMAAFSDYAGGPIDAGIAIFFKGPHSFTGEDVVELQAHGNPIILDMLVASAIHHGARLARPGEFSERAFLNNKIDLVEAEAIADLISAGSQGAARSALASLQGAFSSEINSLLDGLINLRVFIEASLDFPEDEVDFLNKEKIQESLESLVRKNEKILAEARQGAAMTEGLTLVIAGKPNAGKSSLLNALTRRETAIVSSLPGTTRDIIREQIHLDGVPLHIVDTAGLRESADAVEQEGIRRAQREIQRADHVLLVVDSCEEASKKITLEDVWPGMLGPAPTNIPHTLVFNKCDLSGLAPGIESGQVTLSAQTGDGMSYLEKHLKKLAGFQDNSACRFSARRRHLSGLEASLACLERALNLLMHSHPPELVAEELRLAQQAMEVITGRFTPDDLLDKIFRDFCIGK